MICRSCANAADGTIVKVLNEKTLRFDIIENKHCDEAGCTCQHKEPGSWNGSVPTQR